MRGFPRPRDLGVLAELVAGGGAAGVLRLILRYATDVPRGRPYIFGTVNDPGFVRRCAERSALTCAPGPGS